MKRPSSLKYFLLPVCLSVAGAQGDRSRDVWAVNSIKVRNLPKIETVSQRKVPYAVTTPLMEPRVFAEGVVSTPADEFNVAFTPNGKTVYFTKSIVRSYLYTICVSHFKRGKWRAPEVASFSGLYRDIDPFVMPDGSKLYFVSDRPLPGVREINNVDIWAVEMTAGGWGKPYNLGPPVNSNAMETYPTLTSAGTIYFSSTRTGGKGEADIYRSPLVNGRHVEPENLGEAINSSFAETEAYIARDESFIIFISNRPGGFGSFDFYVSYNRGGIWTKAVNLGPNINSEGYDLSALISPDGRYFFFASDKGFATAPLAKRLSHTELVTELGGLRNGLMNIYQVDIEALNLER